MNTTLINALSRRRTLPNGFAIIAFALIFLCSVTQSHAQSNEGERAIASPLGHLVVASHNFALALPKSNQNDSTGSDDDNGIFLLPDLLPQPNLQASKSSRSHVRAVATAASPAYFTPLLRAPPTA